MKEATQQYKLLFFFPQGVTTKFSELMFWEDLLSFTHSNVCLAAWGIPSTHFSVGHALCFLGKLFNHAVFLIIWYGDLSTLVP